MQNSKYSEFSHFYHLYHLHAGSGHDHLSSGLLQYLLFLPLLLYTIYSIVPWKPFRGLLSYSQEKLNVLLWPVKANIMALHPLLTSLISSSTTFLFIFPLQLLWLPSCSHALGISGISFALNTLPYIIYMVSLSLSGFYSKNTLFEKISLTSLLKYPPPHPSAVHI